MGLGNLLKGLLGGKSKKSQDDILDALDRVQGSDQIDLDDMLGGLIGGQTSSGGQPDIADLVGMLGGLQQAGGQQGMDLDDILQGALGGRAEGQQDGFGLDDVLGMVMGGGSGQVTGQNMITGMVANMLSEKFGISPQIATMIVSFIASQLLAGKATKAQSGQATAGLDLDHLLDQVGRGGIQKEYLQNTGAVDKLASQTGLDTNMAADTMQDALGMILGGGKDSGLDGLLESWGK